MIPMNAIDGIEVQCTEIPGISKVKVVNFDGKKDLSWDRYVRLNAAAKAIRAVAGNSVLDAGGYDGALALFLSNGSIDLIDSFTTGGSVLSIPVTDEAYDVVAAIDVLEHIEPGERSKALAEFARVARRFVILNYPCQDSREAQELALKLTNNALVKEHVQWELPDSGMVLSELAKYGFEGTVRPHTSIAVWLGQYITLNLLPNAAIDLNRHLVENYAEEPFSKPLYHLVVCKRDNTR